MWSPAPIASNQDPKIDSSCPDVFQAGRENWGCVMGVDAPAAYFTEFEMFLNFELSVVPRVVTAEMITIAMRAAIRPYSIAVAPVSSHRKRFSSVITIPYLLHHPTQPLRGPRYEITFTEPLR